MNCQNLVEVMIDSSKLCRLSYSGNTAISFSLNASGPSDAEYTMWTSYGPWDAEKIEFLSKMRNLKVFKLSIIAIQALLVLSLFLSLIILFINLFHFTFYLGFAFSYITSNQLFLFNFFVKNVIIPKELRETLPSSLYNVKHLKLSIPLPFTRCKVKELLDGLLWISPLLDMLVMELCRQSDPGFDKIAFDLIHLCIS